MESFEESFESKSCFVNETKNTKPLRSAIIIYILFLREIYLVDLYHKKKQIIPKLFIIC